MTIILDDETLRLYIEESKEHLETIESDLLELEQQGENFDDELVNKVFRAAHSIKGGGGFLGLTNIKELAHKIENLLHLVRTNQIIPSEKLINVLLSSYDRLGELVNNPTESNQMEISNYVEQLESVVNADSSSSQGDDNQGKSIKHPKLDIVFLVNSADLKVAQENGKFLYILDFDLVKDVHKQNKTPLDIITLLGDSGVVIEIKTILPETTNLFEDDNSDSEMIISALFTSIVEPDLIGIVFNLDENKINVITQERIKSADAYSSTAPVESPRPEVVEEKAVAQEEPSPVIESDLSKPDEKIEEPPEKPVDVKPVKQKEAPVKSLGGSSETLRVNVDVLNRLMNRASELVLARNQLIQEIGSWNRQNVIAAGQRVDMVTSELQETIMLTRMQPVGIIFNKFPRLVRGLAMDLGKKIDLELEGTDVELDKTIIEGLGDPLTHLVRNSADHGIEAIETREAKGKNKTGKILLRAFYESGQVLIEIIDDGKGLDAEKIAEKAIAKGLYSADEVQSMSEKEKLNLIMLPGFSTAEKVTDVSGRGVGMDVVKTNLDKMGGQVELISKVDQGTTIRIKLPLTLAIIPSLLVESTQQRFALPQANVAELLRIPAAEVREKIEKIGEADVLILRGELIPILQLNNVLELRSTYYDFKSGSFKEDRREGIIDERLLTGESKELQESRIEKEALETASDKKVTERRKRRESDVIIVVLNDGNQKYGLIVDAVFDSVEIVVKPLGRHLNKCIAYAGATIMGDGRVALILDVRGIAEKADLKMLSDLDQDRHLTAEEAPAISGATRQTLLIFHNGPDESCAVPLDQVLRVERIFARDIEIRGGKKIIQYRGGSLTVYALEEVANVEMLEDRDKLIVIIFKVAGKEVGLLAVQPLDVVDQELVLDDKTLRQPGIAGSTIINSKTTLLVDILEIVQILNPHWFKEVQSKVDAKRPGSDQDKQEQKQILLVEDSQFFRSQVKRFIEEEGYSVVEAEDGQVAWNYIDQNPDSISVVVTDLEMPNMDGFELTSHLKSDERFSSVPVIALTSLAADEDIERGKEVGIDEYQIKLDREKLLESIQDRFGR